MTLRNLSLLRNSIRSDVWLIAAGKSLDYVEPGFFENKVTLGINTAFRRFDCTYLLVRDRRFFDDVYNAGARRGSTVLAARNGFWNPREREPNIPADKSGYAYYVFDCEYPAEGKGLDLDVLGTDTLVTGMSTVHTAMHAAAYLGARNIILCGADGGYLDGEKYFNGYRAGNASPNVGDFAGWLKDVEQQTVILRDALRIAYGCHVVSLNPFVNFGLEGHRYTRA